MPTTWARSSWLPIRRMLLALPVLPLHLSTCVGSCSYPAPGASSSTPMPISCSSSCGRMPRCHLCRCPAPAAPCGRRPGGTSGSEAYARYLGQQLVGIALGDEAADSEDDQLPRQDPATAAEVQGGEPSLNEQPQPDVRASRGQPRWKPRQQGWARSMSAQDSVRRGGRLRAQGAKPMPPPHWVHPEGVHGWSRP